MVLPLSFLMPVAVSLREKASFFFSVNNVLGTALLLAFWPEYIPLSYTLQAAY